MSLPLELKLTSNINSIFEETNANYANTANRTFKFLNETCGGRWFVMVGPQMVLNNNRELCGSAKKFEAYSFNATYEYSDSIHLFSPVCN